MKLYFSGSEIKIWRELLISQQVPTVSLSFVGLTRRSDSIASKFLISENYPSTQEVFLDSGAYTLNKSDKYTKEQAKEIAENYMVFIERNIDSLAMVSEFDANILGKGLIDTYRSDFYSTLPSSKFMPIWHAEDGMDYLERLASTYDIIGVTQVEMHDKSLSPVFNSIIKRYGVKLHGVAITGREMMKSVNWTSVSSTSWLSPSKYGDTIIWNGRELKRFPKAYKDRARKTHRNLFTDIGLDYNKIDADDSTELLKLSIWSWQQFVNSISPVTTMALPQIHDFKDSPAGAVGIQATETRNGKLVPRATISRETVPMPIFGTIRKRDDNEDGTTTETPLIFRRSESNRICETCFIREKCPAFAPNSNCAYNIPIEIKTKEQRNALRKSLIEMQAQRVAFMQFSEDLEGGYVDANLSSEIDRLNRMIKADEESEKIGFSMHVDVSATNQGPGFMQKLLGQEAVTKLREIEPIRADELIKDSEIYDVEVVS